MIQEQLRLRTSSTSRRLPRWLPVLPTAKPRLSWSSVECCMRVRRARALWPDCALKCALWYTWRTCRAHEASARDSGHGGAP
jgi:hypothetical protein